MALKPTLVCRRCIILEGLPEQARSILGGRLDYWSLVVNRCRNIVYRQNGHSSYPDTVICKPAPGAYSRNGVRSEKECCRITYLLPNPNADQGSSFMPASMLLARSSKRSGLNLKGSGYVRSSWRMALIIQLGQLYTREEFPIRTKH